MNTLNTLSCSKFIFLLFSLTSLTVFSQEDDKILEAYQEYTKAPREVVYLHLNKSTYFIGETIGFTAYVLDKKDKKPSLLTTNLYVSIEDKASNIVKQKLIMVNNGVASNTIEVDSLFSNGNYTIKAYTKWMLNFNEQNYFVESIKIKDLKVKDSHKSTLTDKNIDAQFLPESGHLLHGVENNIGVVIKDHNGYGIPFAEGEVVDKNGNVLTTFKTNKLGIGRFPLIADINNNYKVNISNTNKDSSFKLNQKIESNGIILSVKRLKERLFVSAITNTATLNSIKNKRYSLLLHNGETSDLMDIYFIDDTKVTKIIELNGSPGVNILTLFNENDQPIAERLVFNYQGINILKSASKPLVTSTADSLSFLLNIKTIDTTQFHNISISVLPKDTKAYQRHHNLISYTYLQPYLKGSIENGKYYFTDITEKKKFELDNLLITQGWSSYSWNTIFKGSPNISHYFEQGISVKANFPSKDVKDTDMANRLMYYLNEQNFMISELKEGETNYLIDNLFPEKNNTLKLSEITIADGLRPASMYLQFFPRQIPNLETYSISPLGIKEPSEKNAEIDQNNIMFQSTEKVEKLNEVIIKSNPVLIKRERENELSNGKFGRVSVITEEDENTYITLREYLKWKTQNWRTTSGPNTVTTGVSGTENGSINFFLNDMLVIDFSRLDELFLLDVDYIEFNRFGDGDGMRSPAGFIKIYTKESSPRRSSKKTTKAYQFPLIFSAQKKFYAPKYRYYNDDFYKNYGVIDWKPNLTVGVNGNISVEIAKPEVPITLFIEGIANDGNFISEEKSVILKGVE